MPEVTLGIIPGAGGTQRLPRLIGVETSIELICAGTRIKADEALQLGLINQIVKDDLIGNAIVLATSMFGSKKRIRELTTPKSTAANILAASNKALKLGKNRPQVQKAIEMI